MKDIKLKKAQFTMEHDIEMFPYFWLLRPKAIDIGMGMRIPILKKQIGTLT